MEGRMGRRGGRPHPQHQNKTGECLERSQSETDHVPRPNGSGGEASSDSATAFVFGGESAPKARAISCEFVCFFFNTRESLILREGKARFITRTATDNTALSCAEELLISGPPPMRSI